MIFHEIYGAYYEAVRKILSSALSGSRSVSDIEKIVRETAFGESTFEILPALSSGKWKLMTKAHVPVVSSVPRYAPTTVQKRFMASVLLDPRVRLFFDTLPEAEEGIEPLFLPQDVVYYDRYLDSDPFSEESYIRNFRRILHAIEEKTTLKITYHTGKGERKCGNFTPCRLEYSEKDDKFRLFARRVKGFDVINLARIEQVLPLTRSSVPDRFVEVPERRDFFTMTVTDERNALERVLLHFSHFEKETEKLNGNRYRVTVRYDPRDETELLIRVLSFGPFVRVTAPDRFVSLVKERLDAQLALFASGESG